MEWLAAVLSSALVAGLFLRAKERIEEQAAKRLAIDLTRCRALTAWSWRVCICVCLLRRCETREDFEFLERWKTGGEGLHKHLFTPSVSDVTGFISSALQ
jgi:hypothetical protein